MFRLTDRDLDYLRMVCRFPFVTAPQVQEWVHGARDDARISPVYRRLRALEEHELIVSDRVMQSAPRFISATRAGMRAVGVEGRVMTAKFSQFRHDLGVVDLALYVRSLRPTFTLVTEREMRTEDTANQYRESARPVWAVQRLTGDPARRRLFPDLLQVSPEGVRVVHELELTPKTVARLQDIQRAYLTDDRIGSVRYWVGPDARSRVEEVAETVNTWAERERFRHRVAVQPWPREEGR